MTFEEFKALAQNPPYPEGNSVNRIDVHRFKHKPQADSCPTEQINLVQKICMWTYSRSIKSTTESILKSADSLATSPVASSLKNSLH